MSEIIPVVIAIIMVTLIEGLAAYKMSKEKK